MSTLASTITVHSNKDATMSIWTDTESRYGSYPSDTNNVSNSTMRRWVNERRGKHRRAKALHEQARTTK